jgi:signal transduction histidine kinase/CheY-like chemotaxis protein
VKALLLRGWLGLALLCCLWTLGAPARAQSPDVVDAAASTVLTPKLSILIDRGGDMTLQQALMAPGWEPATPANLNRGHSTDTVWLRGAVHNGGSQQLTRWLAVGSIRLEWIRFTRLTQDLWQEAPTMLSGTSQLMEEAPVRANASYIFPIEFQPGERVDYVLQIRSRSVVSIAAKLWEPAAFRQNEGQDAQSQGLLLGPMIMAALYALVMGLRIRDRDFLVLACCIGVMTVYNLQFYGVLFQIFPAHYDLLGRATQPLTALNTASCALMTMTLLRLDLERLWRWAYGAPLILFVLASAACLQGDFPGAAGWLRDIMASFDLVCIASIVVVLWRHRPGTVLPALACLLIWLVLLSRLLTVYGVLPDLRMSTSGLNWASNCAVFLALSIVIGRRVRDLHESQLAIHRARMDTKALEVAVRDRTRELQAALIAADEANNAKTDFLTRISHDLRTPLTSIIGFADLVQVSGNKGAERGRIIRRSADHMLAMIDDLIDYARGGDPDALDPAPAYTHALFDAIAQEAEALAHSHGNRFACHVPRPLPPVLELDTKRVRQVLGNLLDNASKFTSGGLIELTLEWRDADDGAAVQLLIEVRDNGRGIAPEDQQRVFEPFLRLDRSRTAPGLGLGLAIVNAWVMRMKGELRLESAPGQGTSVRVTLNARRAGEDQVAHHVHDDGAGMLPEMDGAGLHIWLAEDAADIRALLIDDLTSQGFQVEAAADGLELIRRMKLPGVRPPALVLTDKLMPGADGDAVLRAARRHLPGVPVALLSATPRFRSGDHAEALEFDASLLKPINLAELRITLARLLGLPCERPGEAPVAAVPDAPPEAALQTMRELIEIGAMSDLVDWSRTLEARHEHAAFARYARQLAQDGDLAQLRRISAA